MTFGSPGVLFGLLLVPLVVWAYVRSRQRRKLRTATLASQGLVKGKPDADKIIAARYIRPWTGVHGTDGSR